MRAIQRGRTEAVESKPVAPADPADVEQVAGHVAPTVAAMMRVQLLTAARPGEVCDMRPADTDRSGPAWAYRPAHHENIHHGHDRTVFIGPKAQAVLLPFLDAAADDKTPVFSPAAAAAEQRRARTAKRVTPASHGNRVGTNRVADPKRKPGRGYTATTYCRAITRGCEAAGVAPFAPNQLRHLAATVIRREHGLEAAQVILGHSRADVTQVYAERDAASAKRIIGSVG